jgi:hypothetical protein
MEFALTDDCDASAAANAVIIDSAGPIRRPRKNVGGRKKPNHDSVFRVGSTKRVTGTIQQAHWYERQYADLKKYFLEKHTSQERSAAGCFQWKGGRNGKEGPGQASFCGVKYNAQLLFYFAMHPEERMQPGDKVVASCGDVLCLTKAHLELQRVVERRAVEAAAAAHRQPRTACFSLAQWKAMTAVEVDAVLSAPLRYTAPQ